MLESAACHLCMDMLSSPHPLPQGMMGAYGPPYMPMQGPHEGLLSVAPMPPHPAGGAHLPSLHLQQGMPGYPGMPHQGKGHCPSHTCLVTPSRVSPAGGVYLDHGLHSLNFSLNSENHLVFSNLSQSAVTKYMGFTFTHVMHVKTNQTTNIQRIVKN